MRFFIIFLLTVTSFVAPFTAQAGPLESPAPPDDLASATYTGEDLWNRLRHGTLGEKRTYLFSEPMSGPGDYGHTIDELMSIAPEPDATDGALPENVPEGMTFWCVNPEDGKWGPREGKMAMQSLSPAEKEMRAGYYEAASLDQVDTDLVPENIVSGREIFGVDGSAPIPSGDAEAADVRTGRTFSNASDVGIPGAMPEGISISGANGQLTITIPNGYYAGKTATASDTNLSPANIKSGVTIFGETGSAPIPSGNAVAADVLNGKTFSNAGSVGVAGTMTNVGQQNVTPTTSAHTITQGYHDGTGQVTGDANLVEANIVSGKTIFGVAGSAAAYPAPVERTGQTGCWDTGGVSIDCAGTRQDGEYLKGVVRPPPFKEHGDGTVTDNLTGLMWVQNANAIGELNSTFDNDSIAGDGKVTWQHALGFVAGVNAAIYDCGVTIYDDWRLPNRKELLSLIDLSQATPALPAGHPFDNVQNYMYWTSTTYAADPSKAWGVYLDIGFVGDGGKTSGGYYVWPVRAGQ